MSKEDSIRSQIKDFLEDKPPLTVVTLDELYKLPLITTEQRHSVRAAIYGVCAGTPVSESNKPTIYSGIRLILNNGKQVILSLPGVPREDLQNDHTSDTKTDRIILSLQKKYGIEAINYWGKSAQRRSVDLASYAMRAAKIRDKKVCLLCGIEGVSSKQPISACHIISRKTLFWAALDEVEKTNNTIFSNESTILLSKKLKNNDLHSNPKYIVTLCHEHNKLLLEALSLPRSPQGSEDEALKEKALFDN